MTASSTFPPSCPSYDVCIIGSGPAALACLSAIREPYSVDSLSDVQVQRALRGGGRKQLSVCVVDPHPDWMQGWSENFAKLDIRHLRSPVKAHPNMFDSNALLAYALHAHREDDLFESGCSDVKRLVGLGQTQVGLWKLPSTALFLDFCRDLVRQLKHTYLQGSVIDIEKKEEGSDGQGENSYKIEWKGDADDDSRFLTAQKVIVAAGAVGRPVVPPGLIGCPNMCGWQSPEAFRFTSSLNQRKQRVLVVGGGLTAVQVALRVLESNDGIAASCVLCSRRPLQEKHFDIPIEWFDERTNLNCLSKFYHNPIEDRLSQLKQARDGGSVPNMYLARLQKHEGLGLTCWVGEDLLYNPQDQEHGEPFNDCNENDETGVTVRFQGVPHQFDRIILACGIKPDCTAHPVMKQMQSKWPIEICGGFPDLTQDLRWREGMDVFVTGASAALQVGPDSGNLMGMRRAAQTIAHAMECRTWLRQTALVNPFELLFDDSETESEGASEHDCDTCCGRGEDNE